jgi:hypothetical protein
MTAPAPMSPTWADLAPCEWPTVAVGSCDRRATEVVGDGRTAAPVVLCGPHAAAYRADTASPEPASYAECQADTATGPCGIRCDGSTYCRTHSRTAGLASSWAERDATSLAEWRGL